MVHSRAVSSDSTGTLNNKWNLVKDRHRQAEKNFIGAEVKPQLNQSSSDPNTDGIAHDSGLSSGRPVKLQSSASNRQSVFSFKPICSPEFYVVTLSHGTCTRKVVTKVRITRSFQLRMISDALCCTDVLRSLYELHGASKTRPDGISIGQGGSAWPH